MMRTTYEAIQQEPDPRGRRVSENPHFETGETQ